MENFLLVAGLIEAHPNREVHGRTRLQRTVRLLQRIGLGTDYAFSIRSHGPYSEELHSDIAMIRSLGLAEEAQEAEQSFILRATPEARNALIDPFRDRIQALADAETETLDLSATYDAFREMGADNPEAIRRLSAKKGRAFGDETMGKAFVLLNALGLPAPELSLHASL